MPSTNNRQPKTEKAFTLIELLVVIAIVGILAGLAVVSMSGATEAAKVAKSKVFSDSLRNSLLGNRVTEWKFDEGANNTVFDTIGTSNGDITGHAPAWKIGADCVSGSCLQFDGSSNYVEVSGFTLAKIAGDKLTVEAWVKPSSLFGTQYIVSKNGPFFLYMSGNKLGGSIYNGSSWTTLTGNISLNNGWQYLIMAYDGSNIKLYVNGVFDVSTPKTGNLAGDGCTQIGTYNNGGCAVRSQYFNGTIDEVRIYNQVFTASHVRENYLAKLKELLSNEQIKADDYQQKIAELNSTYATNK
jgi:prepilin-type N-terminal cleavage/methylation domain-containing protein